MGSSENGQSDSSNAWWFPKKKTVSMINDVGPELDLTVHCKSKDDDLGTHVIPYKSFYSFRFKPNMMDTTLFFCSMTWKGSKLNYFDIYREERDKDKCSVHCSWNIRATGPCMWNPDKQFYNDCFPWNKP
ncbi:S-protein homolog 5-like [Mercurialis annua]|uniref:S-protein homolog 5-like n=1 Tax=Mercurialis annua TaxID=3986 RepID=UPI00215E2BC7|nr:S-protein homolog 5-like [Mercurialis annua]